MNKSTQQRHVMLGAAAWVVAAVVFFSFHFIVQAGWSHPAYSWAANNVSDLGNIHCQRWGDNQRYVCSPRHALMNAGFIAAGVLMAVGTVLLRSHLSGGIALRIARWLLILEGLAFVLVGLAPADVNLGLHLLAVPFIFVGGNVGLVLIGLRAGGYVQRVLRMLAVAMGVIGLAATCLFFSFNYLMLGMGGTERFAGLTMMVWTGVAGISIALSRVRRPRQGALKKQPVS